MKKEVEEKRCEAKAWAVATRIRAKAEKPDSTAGALEKVKLKDSMDGEFSSPMFERETESS